MEGNILYIRQLEDKFFRFLTKISTLIIALLLFSIAFSLIIEALPAFKNFGLGFIFSGKWSASNDVFGAGAPIIGTLLSSVLALSFSLPLALCAGIFLEEICPSKFKETLSALIELLASIPSIIYGMLGLFFVVPLVKNIFGGAGLGILSASIVLSIMILPLISAVTRASLKETPRMLKESAYAIGSTKFEVIKNISIPYAKASIIGGIILALGRALGETMAVTYIIGNSHFFKSLVSPAVSIPSLIANEFTEASSPIHYSSMFYLALILFILNFGIIYIMRRLLINKKSKKLQQKYK